LTITEDWPEETGVLKLPELVVVVDEVVPPPLMIGSLEVATLEVVLVTSAKIVNQLKAMGRISKNLNLVIFPYFQWNVGPKRTVHQLCPQG
jgi:hypothetical protein